MTVDDIQFGPECINCGDKHNLNEFDSEAWMQIDTTRKSHDKDTIHKPGPIELIWVCPACIDKKANPEMSIWREIMKKAISGEHGLTATIDTYILRKILEKHKILPKTKDGM